MADRRLENIGSLSGIYADMPFEDTLSSPLEVPMAEIPFLKTADQELWVSGPLTLTFTLDNRESDGALQNIVIRDTLDNTKFSFIAGSVTAQLILGTDPENPVALVPDEDYTVTFTPGTATDELMITFLADGDAGTIAVGDMVVVSFRGDKVPEV